MYNIKKKNLLPFPPGILLLECYSEEIIWNTFPKYMQTAVKWCKTQLWLTACWVSSASHVRTHNSPVAVGVTFISIYKTILRSRKDNHLCKFIQLICACCCCCLVVSVVTTLCDPMDCRPPGSSVPGIL